MTLVGLQFIFLGFMRNGAVVLEFEGYALEIILPLAVVLAAYALLRLTRACLTPAGSPTLSGM